MIEEVEQAWLEHIPAYPFHMSVGTDVSQFVINNEAEFLTLCYHNLNKDIFVAVNNITDRQNKTFRTIYIDIDSINIPQAYEELKVFCRILNMSAIKYRVYFSGSKGFAIYIDFKPTVIEKMRERLQVLIDTIIDVMGFKLFDRGVCVDIHRISRLPYSVNSKSNKMCHPLPTDERLFHLDVSSLGTAKETIIVERDYTDEIIPQLLLELELPKKQEVEYPKANSDYATELNYLMKYAEHLIAGVRHHAVRLKIIPTMVMLGHNDSTIVELSKQFFIKTYGKFSNTDGRWVISQIRLVRSKNIRPILLTNLAIRYGINGTIGI